MAPMWFWLETRPGWLRPSSGEGIYYAMVGGRVSATAASAFLTTGRAKRPAIGTQAVYAGT